MKKLLYIVILITCTYVGYWCGCQTWFMDTNHKPHWFNTEEARLAEVKYANACLEGLHWYYLDNKDYWNNIFKKTNEYKNIEIANEGDWEDFYSDEWK